MANSLIEDVMNEGPINNDGEKKQKQPKNKGSKKAIIILIILLLIIIIAAVIVMLVLSSRNSEVNAKQAFFESVTKNNIEQVGSIDLYEELLTSVASESSTVETNVNISYSTEDVSVNNIELNIDSSNDLENLRSYSDMTLSYSDNELFNLELLATGESFALKSDEIVDSFVGATYSYLIQSGLVSFSTTTTPDITTTPEEYDDTDNYLMTEDDTLYSEDVETEDFNTESLTISDESIQIYTDILNNNLDDSQFTANEVTLNMESGTVDCTEYTLTMSEEQFLDICKQILEAFETDADTINVFSTALSLAGYSETQLIAIVDNMIEQLENAEVDENSNVVIKVYDNNGQTVKLSIEYSGITMEIEYVYGDSESSIKITSVEDETGEGISYKITNRKSDLTQNLDFEISFIENDSVNQTITFATEVIRSGSEYTFNMNIDSQETDTSLTIESSSNIQFTDVEVEDLTSENSVLLDDLTEEQQTELLNSISERLQFVLSEKMSELSFIDTNTNTTIVDQSSSTEEDDTVLKEAAKQDLITAIQNEMTESINNGEEYTLQNLEGLQVDGHIVEVEISDDIAIVTVDGYTFNIDSEFNLSE